MEKTLARLVDRELVREVVEKERRTRDATEWEAMAECFTPDCYINLSWYKGPAKDFIAGSRQQRTFSVGFHYIWTSNVELDGDRAFAQTPMEVHIRYPYEGLEVEVVVHSVLVSRVVRTEDGWRLASLDVIYKWDEARCSNPDVPLPIRWDDIKDYRWSMRMISWAVATFHGAAPDDTLLGFDRPEEIAAFQEHEHAWLAGADLPVYALR